MKLMKCFLWIRGVWIAIENLGVNRKLMWEIYIRNTKLKNLLLKGKRFRMGLKEVPDRILTKPDIV